MKSAGSRQKKDCPSRTFEAGVADPTLKPKAQEMPSGEARTTAVAGES